MENGSGGLQWTAVLWRTVVENCSGEMYWRTVVEDCSRVVENFSSGMYVVKDFSS